MFKRKKQGVIIDDSVPNEDISSFTPFQHSNVNTPAGMRIKGNWFKRHKKLSIILAITLVLLIGAGTAAHFTS